jgi:cell division protein FtsA
MAKQERVLETYVAGIDIGTSHVRVVIARPREGGGIDVVGTGQAVSKGLRKGVVVNLDATVESVQGAVEEAELMAGFAIEQAYVGVAGAHVRGVNSRGVVAVPHADGRVRQEDVARVLEAAKSIQLPRDREILHAVPQDFTVDEQAGVAHPVGMPGARLEANVHVVTAGSASTQNLITCVNRAGVSARGMVLEALAIASCTLTDDEKELGVALVDIGGGTTDVAVFEKGAIWHVASLQVGGDHFTNDIAVGLRTPTPDAERLKRKHGAALAELVPEDVEIEVPSVGARRPRLLSLQILSEIIQPRAEEIFGLVKDELDRAGHGKTLNGGLVLVGGASLMPGMAEVAEQVFELPVRTASPRGVGGILDAVGSPAFATAVGLATWGLEHGGASTTTAPDESFSIGKLGGRVAGWLTEIFEPATQGSTRRASR